MKTISDLAIATMLDVVQADERVLQEPAPIVFVSDLADSAAVMLTRALLVRNSASWFDTNLHLAAQAIKAALEAEGHSPFPTRSARCASWAAAPSPLAPARGKSRPGGVLIPPSPAAPFFRD